MISSPASFSISYNMTTIKELTSIMINQHSTAIASASFDINKDLIRLLAAEYKFDADDAIKRFLEEPDDDVVVSIPKSSKKSKKSNNKKDKEARRKERAKKEALHKKLEDLGAPNDTRHFDRYPDSEPGIEEPLDGKGQEKFHQFDTF